MTKMKKKTSKRFTHALAALLACGLAVGAVALITQAAQAQVRGVTNRSVEGIVRDASDTPLKGAVVYLKDTRTLAIKSFLSDDDGNFHFSQLSNNTDYEIYAEFNGKRSKPRGISSFDSKNEFNFTLKIDVSK